MPSHLNINDITITAASTGQWQSQQESSASLTSFNPSTGEPIATLPTATSGEYEEIVKRAQAQSLTWRDTPAPQRGQIIRDIGEELRRHKTDLSHLVALEMGKSYAEAEGEVQEAIDMAEFAVGQSRMLYGLSMHSERPQHRLYEQWLPLGVVGVMTAFNFPVAVWAWNAFLAVICGNTVMWRPSPKTPLCALAIQDMCNTVCQKHALDGLFSVFISDDIGLAQQFVSDERVHLVSFTGSSAVGHDINLAVHDRFGKSLLELSGNNAMIIDTSADLSLAIPAVVFGAIGTAGQRCTTIRRLFVHDDLFDTIQEKLIAAYKQVTIGDPLDTKNLMGPLIDQAAVDQFTQAVASAKQAGGTVLYGGGTVDAPGYFVQPTLMLAENDWPIVQQETFGPLLYLMRFTDFKHAVTLQNQSRYGLSSALFSQNIHHIEYFLSASGSDCGIANINMSTSGAEIGGAFGGEKHTGGGRESGSDAWRQYMRRQTVGINWGDQMSLAQGISFDIT